MALHPHEQKKAQQEIDSITGGGQRTVALEDRPNMPYMRALLKEVARWHVVVPMSMPPVFWSIEVLAYDLLLEGVPRRTAETDVYNGKLFFLRLCDSLFTFGQGIRSRRILSLSQISGKLIHSFPASFYYINFDL